MKPYMSGGLEMAKAKTSAKKKAKAVTTTSSRTIAVRPTARQLAAAKKCLERSGKILIGFKDVSVTKLPSKIEAILNFKD